MLIMVVLLNVYAESYFRILRGIKSSYRAILYIINVSTVTAEPFNAMALINALIVNVFKIKVCCGYIQLNVKIC